MKQQRGTFIVFEGINGSGKGTQFSGSIEDYTDFIPEAYFDHAKEIVQDNPSFVVVPAGSGKLWFSIVQEVRTQSLSTRVLGITPKGQNGFYG
ncbi:hypothetical protein COV17_03445 [Candidatus Woesearchaeota archaeon CG10_big_fil_rev_8_21_14_0_10_36_11]|nr:MAG: hypothetical protein COV17_03445 [Candidatus Woesearchaeota archaeon CG10_big_fil_rev_8_21_14_0_10_36_11]